MADWPRSHHGIWQKPKPWPCLRETMNLCRNVILKHNGRKLGVEHLISIENKTSRTVPKQRLNHIICRFGGLKMLKQFQGGALVKCLLLTIPIDWFDISTINPVLIGVRSINLANSVMGYHRYPHEIISQFGRWTTHFVTKQSSQVPHWIIRMIPVL